MNPEPHDEEMDKKAEELARCDCAYCRSGGMSKSGADCADRMVEVSRSMKESLIKIQQRSR